MKRKRGGGAWLWAVLQLSATPWHTEHAECQVVVGENGSMGCLLGCTAEHRAPEGLALLGRQSWGLGRAWGGP